MIPNWFAAYGPDYFEHHLVDLVGESGIRALQIGAFAGDASVWLLENVLTGDDCMLIDVDTWQGNHEIPDFVVPDFSAVERKYDQQTAPYRNIHKVQMSSAQFFSSHYVTTLDLFDFVYVDADHTLAGCSADRDALPSVLKRGSIVAFDDYNHPAFSVTAAVQPLLTDPRWEVLGDLTGPQAWFSYRG